MENNNRGSTHSEFLDAISRVVAEHLAKTGVSFTRYDLVGFHVNEEDGVVDVGFVFDVVYGENEEEEN